MRRGFTLVELLVATGVFLFGFTAAMSLFLIGTRARTQADGMLRLSLAATSLVEELRMEAGREPSAPHPPSAYIGDGFAATGPDDPDALFPYAPQPGVWYRILTSVDESGGDDPLATGVRLDLLAVWNPTGDVGLTLAELGRRQRIDRQPSYPTDPDEQTAFLAAHLARRGFAVRETAWIVRKPSWER